MVDYSRYEALRVDKDDKVAIISLNRPQTLNVFDPVMHREVEDILEDVARDDAVEVAILTGAGRAFSAGGDIRTMERSLEDPTAPRTPMEGGRRLIRNILHLEKPLLAAVNGDAIGLGATLALFCDIIIAAENARIGDPHVKVGLVAGDGGAVIWPLLVGPARAKEYLMTGDLLSAREAERIGLINRVVPQEELMPTTLTLAKRLASGPTKAIRWTKLSINKRLWEEANLIFDTSFALEFLSFQTHDHREAVKAFLERRQPRFKGT